MKTDSAAGTSAALSVQAGVQLCDLDTALLGSQLVADDTKLPRVEDVFVV